MEDKGAELCFRHCYLICRLIEVLDLAKFGHSLTMALSAWFKTIHGRLKVENRCEHEERTRANYSFIPLDQANKPSTTLNSSALHIKTLHQSCLPLQTINPPSNYFEHGKQVNLQSVEVSEDYWDQRL